MSSLGSAAYEPEPLDPAMLAWVRQTHYLCGANGRPTAALCRIQFADLGFRDGHTFTGAVHSYRVLSKTVAEHITCPVCSMVAAWLDANARPDVPHERDWRWLLTSVYAVDSMWSKHLAARRYAESAFVTLYGGLSPIRFRGDDHYEWQNRSDLAVGLLGPRPDR